MADILMVSSSDGLMDTIVEVEREPYNECRVCLQNLETEAGYSLAGLVDAGASEQTQSLQDIMANVCLIVFEPDDGLPDIVCEDCKEALLSAFKLQLLAQASDAELRRRHNMPTETDYKRPVTLDSTIAELEEEDEIEEDDDEIEGDPDAGQVVKDEVTDERGPQQQQDYPECDVCGKRFRKLFYLYRHKSMHVLDPERPFQCKVCYRRFHLNSTLKLHAMIHDKALIESHSTAEPPLIYRCQECSAEFDSQEAFDDHWRVHDTGLLEDHHSMISEPAREYKCVTCNILFTDSSLFDVHMRTVHSEKATHKCKICGQAYPLGSLLVEHLNTHMDMQQNQCEACGKVFRTKRNLQQHKRIHNSSADGSALCVVCGKGFATQSSLAQHLARHTGEKPFACEECPGKFGTKASLITHMRIHSGAKPYACKDCDSAFSTHFSLSKHKRIHSGERPYVCEICGMRFNSSYHVRRHIRTHTGDKPYQCPYCDRSFAQSNDLVKHKRSHIGKNTYQCPDCPEAFRLHGELRRHVAQHFKENKKRQEMEEAMATATEVVVTTT